MSGENNSHLVSRYIPVIPDEFKVYNSYVEDPKWQIKFTIIWTSILAFTTITSIPFIYRQMRFGEYYRALAISQDTDRNERRVHENIAIASVKRASIRFQTVWQRFTMRTVPIPNLAFWNRNKEGSPRRLYLSLSIGQITLVAGYIGISIACFVVGAQLVQNANRPGFIAIAQLPLILLLSLKSPLPVPIFLPKMSYEHYNYLHRWTGRTLFLLVTVHGGLWLNQYVSTNQYDQVWSDKSKRGMIAYGLLCGIVLTSLKPIRRLFYQLFWAAHLMLFVGFFAAIDYHTPYARPWVYSCAAIYGYEWVRQGASLMYSFVIRMIRFRIKEAVLVPIDDAMTMIHILDCKSGWKPTQHVMLRVLSGSGIFESHPFTITTAPTLDGRKTNGGITLYARVSGDWTRKIHQLARDVTLQTGPDVEEQVAFLEKHEKGEKICSGRNVLVTVDGPYGGLKLHMEDHRRILIIAGGSGVTFGLGSIEEAIRVSTRGQEIEMVWITREFSMIHALASHLTYLRQKAEKNGITLRYRLYITRSTGQLEPLPVSLAAFTTLKIVRPDVTPLVEGFVQSCLTQPANEIEPVSKREGNGGMVIACGPESIVMEAQNAISGLDMRDRIEIGGLDFHGEKYSL